MKTVKVRIAVAVAPSGSWCSSGYAVAGKPTTAKDEKEMQGFAGEIWENDQCAEGEAYYWLTAELPVPEAAEITGSAEPAPSVAAGP